MRRCAPGEHGTAAVSPAKLTVAQLINSVQGTQARQAQPKMARTARLQVRDVTAPSGACTLLFALQIIECIACSGSVTGPRFADPCAPHISLQMSNARRSPSTYVISALAANETAAAAGGADEALKLEVTGEGAKLAEVAVIEVATQLCTPGGTGMFCSMQESSLLAKLFFHRGSCAGGTFR